MGGWVSAGCGRNLAKGGVEPEISQKRLYPIRNHNGFAGTIKYIMTAQAASRLPKDHPVKKQGKSKAKEGGGDSLYAVSEHSLAGYLDNEQDLYSEADIKVRYRCKQKLS